MEENRKALYTNTYEYSIRVPFWRIDIPSNDFVIKCSPKKSRDQEFLCALVEHEFLYCTEFPNYYYEDRDDWTCYDSNGKIKTIKLSKIEDIHLVNIVHALRKRINNFCKGLPDFLNHDLVVKEVLRNYVRYQTFREEVKKRRLGSAHVRFNFEGGRVLDL